MDIVIPTLGRMSWAQQATLKQLMAADFYPTVVIQPHERHWWAQQLPAEHIHILPETVKGIAATRDYILHDMEGARKVCMMDDDLHFAVRRTDDRTKFRQPENIDIRDMLLHIGAALDTYPHVSIGSREGGNRVTDDISYNTRMMRVLAYDRQVLKKHVVTFSPMQVMEDFHVTLQLLRLGYDCAVLNNWVSNQAGGSAASGGCSSFRTLQVQADNANLLAARHPGFVKVVQKQTKTAWGGQERTDVIVAWKAARKAGEAHGNR